MNYNPDIRDYMAKYPFTAHPEMGLKEALEYMQKTSIRHLPVLNKDELVGVVSERDLLRHISGVNCKKTVAEVMGGQPWVVAEKEPLSSVVRWMAKQKVGSALVVDEAGKLQGIFTTTDALLILSRILGEAPEMEMMGESVGNYTHPIHLAVV